MMRHPTSTNQTVSWTDVPGGLGITYVVHAWALRDLRTPPFHLLTDARSISTRTRATSQATDDADPTQGEARARQAGLSMIELVVTLVILSVIGTMLVGGWISLQRSFAFAQAKNTARATARDALARMSSEFRGARRALSTTPH